MLENATFHYTYPLMEMISGKYRSSHDFKINNIKKQFWVLLGMLK